jgi:hypothetical protein
MLIELIGWLLLPVLRFFHLTERRDKSDNAGE